MSTLKRGWSSRTRLAAALAAVAIALGLAALLRFFTPGPEEVSPVPTRPPSARVEPGEGAAFGEASTRIDGKEAKARLEIRPGRVGEGHLPSMTLMNVGETEFSYGLPFRLEIRTSDGWHWVNRHQAFNLPLLHLGPGERADSEKIGMYVDTPDPLPFAPGTYRVTRTVDIDAFDETAPSLRVAARFEVMRADGTSDPPAVAGEPFVPYPGSQWYGPDGRPLPMEEEIINVITGPDHCEWQSAAMLHTTWPPGTAPTKDVSSLQYIRDPAGVMSESMSALFEEEALLPPDARYTGYRTDFMEMWVRTFDDGMPVVATASAPDRIYLVFADHIESWPRAKDMIACG